MSIVRGHGRGGVGCLRPPSACRANVSNESYGGGADGDEGGDVVRVFDGGMRSSNGRDAYSSGWGVVVCADVESDGDGRADHEDGERDV